MNRYPGSRHRLDVATRTLVVAERLAQRRDVNGQDAFFDGGVGPHVGQELVLGDETPGLAKEHDQDVVGLRREANDVPSECQPPLGGLERELAEVEDLAVAHDDSANLSKTFGTPLEGGC